MKSNEHQFEYEDQVQIFGPDESSPVPASKSKRWKVTDALEAEQIHDGSTDASPSKYEWELRDGVHKDFLKWFETPSRKAQQEIHRITKSDIQDSIWKGVSKPTLSRSPFKYEDLRTTDDAFRLLVLWPSPNQEDEIESSLIEASLVKGIDYNALSYAWGETSQQDRSIRVNGKVFHVTSSLYSALIMLRNPSGPIALWIDALCINQKSHLEPNTQVLLMSSIYGRAKRVIVWLGSISEEYHHEFDEFAVWWVTNSQTCHVLFDLCSDEVHALRGIITRSWFRRIWVVQEFVLSREAHFVLGPYAFSAEKLLLAFKLLGESLSMRRIHSVEAADLRGRIAYLKQLYFYRQEKDDNSANLSRAKSVQDTADPDSSPAVKTASSFLQVLTEFRHFHSSRPHDKIYGLLGLATAQSLLLEAAPAPDYDKPLMEVFKDWALYFMDQHKDLSVLNSCRANAKDKAFPSWVPDWRERRSTNFHSDFASYHPESRATKNLPPRVSLSSCREMLSLAGIHLATLRASGFTNVPPLKITSSEDYLWDNVGKSMNSRGETAQKKRKYLYRKRVFHQVADGRLALVPKTAQEGDIICILFGGAIPFVLRPFGKTRMKQGHYEYVGNCYLDDCMEGQDCYEYNEDGTSRVQTFILH